MENVSPTVPKVSTLSEECVSPVTNHASHAPIIQFNADNVQLVMSIPMEDVSKPALKTLSPMLFQAHAANAHHHVLHAALRPIV